MDCMLFTILLSFRLNESTAKASVAMSWVAEATNEMIIKVKMV